MIPLDEVLAVVKFMRQKVYWWLPGLDGGEYEESLFNGNSVSFAN